MAEKYGVVPPKFTKEWWEHYWTYYKWHTIVIAFIIIAISSTVYQKMTAPKYDLTMVYAGSAVLSEENTSTLTDALSPFCEDVDGNGKQSIDFSVLTITDTQADPQYTMAMSMKLQLALSEDASYLFIMDEELIQSYAGETAEDCVFRPLSKWLEVSVPDDKIYKLHDTGFALSIEGNKYFEDAGFDTKGKYLAMRFYPRKDQQEQIPGYEAAVKLANAIFK